MSTFEKVAQLLAEYKDLDINTITMDTTFNSLNLDSLDIAEMVMNIEDDMDITLELDENMKTISDIVAAIDAAK